MLMVKCSSCGKEFPSPIQMPKESVSLINVATRCPHCGKSLQLDANKFITK